MRIQIVKGSALHFKLYIIVDDPTETIALFYDQARELIALDVTFAPYLLKIQQEIEACQYYKAVKRGRELVAYERQVSDADVSNVRAGCSIR